MSWKASGKAAQTEQPCWTGTAVSRAPVGSSAQLLLKQGEDGGGGLPHPCPSSWPAARIFPKQNCRWAGLQVGWKPPGEQVLVHRSSLWLISTRNHDSISEPPPTVGPWEGRG